MLYFISLHHQWKRTIFFSSKIRKSFTILKNSYGLLQILFIQISQAKASLIMKSKCKYSEIKSINTVECNVDIESFHK